jgi:acyl-CoA dehydrogenase
MDFEPSDKVKALQETLERFMAEHVDPAEKIAAEQIQAAGDPHCEPEIVWELKQKARSIGLWNLFLPDERYGAGLTNLEYAPLCEIMGRSAIAPRVFNCNAPDTGNMEILADLSRAASGRRDPELLLDDGARGLRIRSHDLADPGQA